MLGLTRVTGFQPGKCGFESQGLNEPSLSQRRAEIRLDQMHSVKDSGVIPLKTETDTFLRDIRTDLWSTEASPGKAEGQNSQS